MDLGPENAIVAGGEGYRTRVVDLVGGGCDVSARIRRMSSTHLHLVWLVGTGYWRSFT